MILDINKNSKLDVYTNNSCFKISNYIYPYDFNHNFYKELYLSDKSYTNEEIVFDFINSGYFNFKYGCINEFYDYNYILDKDTTNINIDYIKKKINDTPEIITIKKYWNNNFKTCIIIHAFNINIFKEIIKHINNTTLPTFCNFLIVSPEKDVITYIRNKMKEVNMTLLYIKNRGMDTYGKLIAFNYILENNLNFEWFLYLHTKTNVNWFNDLINPLLNKKIIDNIYNNTIDKNVYMIGAEDCKTILKVSDVKYKSINLLLNKAGYKVKITQVPTSPIKNYEITDVNEIYAYWKLNIDLNYYINTYKEAYDHYKNNKDNEIRITLDDYASKDSSDYFNYVAGTMYWSRINLIHYYKNMLKFLLSTMNISKRIIYSEYKISTVHLSELLDGILIQLNNKKILFVNGSNNVQLNNFNYIFYKLNNPDIPYTSKNSLTEHYLNYGISENRKTTEKFYTYNSIYKNTNFIIFKNAGYVSNNYNYISYKSNDYHSYSYDSDIYYMNNLYINLNTLLKSDKKNVKYVLIITFSIGGGCSDFLNKLINYYIFNKRVNIIIIKYKSGVYTINYNNLLINKTFNFELITKFIRNINIKHIFINTLYTFPNNFKSFIYSLNIKKYTVTHDFYNFIEIPNPTYFHLKYKEMYKNEINNFDIILTQNIYNIDVMNSICPIKKEIHLIDFPDYCKNITLSHNQQNNKLTNYKRRILIIGTIDYKKGSLLINEIFDKFSNKYNFFIAGNHDNKNINQQEYRSINEFNNILKLFKPDIILFTSLCIETYSYTLTLAMLTELPIIHYDIGDCVISKRLEEYKFDSYKLSDINNFAEIVNDITIHNNDTMKKIIDNTISVSTYWDNIFIYDNYDNYDYENVVLITSKIYVSNNKFSYINKRSIYTKEERFMQTINTISSVKKYIPNVFIILMDNSTFTETEKDVLTNSTNIFINHNDKTLDYHTNVSEIKAIAELCQVKYALCVIKNYNIKFNNFFKITGRYIINNNFVYDMYTKTFKNENIFKKNNSIKDRLYYYTCFYKISQNNFNEYIDKVNELYNELVLKLYENIYNTIDLEFLLPSQLQFKEIDDLGITQYISCFNEISSI